MINNHCYKFEEKNYKKGIFDNFVDATYIITMINSKRHENIIKQLDEYQPTKKIFILYNYGYITCKKNLRENTPSYDLTDAYINILYHSKLQNFNNILILEDDFIFDIKIKDKEIINEINYFMNKNTNNKINFNLGPIPLLSYPNIIKHNNIFKSICSFGSHGIIYNKNIQGRKSIKNY